MILPQAIMHPLEPLVSASDSAGDTAVGADVSGFLVADPRLLADRDRHYEPFWMANLSANREPALAAGAVLPHVYLQGFCGTTIC